MSCGSPVGFPVGSCSFPEGFHGQKDWFMTEGQRREGQKAMNFKETEHVHALIYKYSTTTKRRGKDHRFAHASG